MTRDNEQLGRLCREANLRRVWPDEARDFTPWLAQEENLAQLSQHLGLGPEGLEVQAVEHRVGPFRADILCKNTTDGTQVLIENQLTTTDHTHLGQILTYTAGLDVATNIWVAERITDEHRAALEWLNDLSAATKFGFFGLEIELWRIDDGPLAPKFNTVVRPNDWTIEAVRAKKQIADLTPTNVLRLEYWEEFASHLAKAGTPIRPVKPLAQNWLTHGIGKTNVNLTAVINPRDNWIRAEIYLTGKTADDYFRWLSSERSQIEDDFGAPLVWYDQANIDRRIYIRRDSVDVLEKSTWPEQHRWLVEQMSALHRVFHDRVRKLDPETAGLI